MMIAGRAPQDKPQQRAHSPQVLPFGSASHAARFFKPGAGPPLFNGIDIWQSDR